jgi:hypothetical protein
VALEILQLNRQVKVTTVVLVHQPQIMVVVAVEQEPWAVLQQHHLALVETELHHQLLVPQ